MNLIPNQLPAFDTLDPKQNIAALQVCTENAKAKIEDIAHQENMTWKNLMLPLAEIDEEISRLWSPVSHLHSVCNTDEIRPEYEKGIQIMTQWGTWIAGHEVLFIAIQALKNSAGFAALNQAQQTAITHTLRDFRLAGSELVGKDKERFAEIKMRLAELSTLFEQHVLDATRAFELHLEDESKLGGLPSSVIAGAAQRAEESGKLGYLFTLDIPSYLPFMQYADDANLRKAMYEAFVSRASHGDLDNTAVIDETLKLRDESSKLLGFEHYAAYSLANKMASDVEEVTSFLRDLAKKSRKMAENDLKELQKFAKGTLGLTVLESWDLAYVSEKLRTERYALTQEELKPWFPEKHVKQGMFTLAERLYNITIKQGNAPVWFENVQFFDVFDANGNKKAGFYLDPYARKGKRGGAWMDEALASWRFPDGTLQRPVAYLVCNFDAPVGDKPALWTHDEVITLFHEFGHGLHHMMTNIDVREVSGINGVPWDAVELPSQFMENFCWDREVLDMFALHFETGGPLPDDKFEKMIAAKNYHSGLQMLRQIELSLFDLLLHAHYHPENGDTVQGLLDNVRKEIAVLTPPAINKFQNSFSHIFAGGYAAGYFSYKWAEVLSADAFAAFEEASKGASIVNAKVASRFLDEVLSRGGSRNLMESYKAFRGKEPSVDALLKHNGISA